MLKNKLTWAKVTIILVLGVTVYFEKIKDNSEITNGYLNKSSFFNGEVADLFLNDPLKSSERTYSVYNVFDHEQFQFTSVPLKQTTKPDICVGSRFKKSGEMKIEGLKTGLYSINKKVHFIVKPNSLDDIDYLVVYPYRSLLLNQMLRKETFTNAKCEYSVENPCEVSMLNKRFIQWLENQQEFKIGYISDEDLDSIEIPSSVSAVVLAGNFQFATTNTINQIGEYYKNGGNLLTFSTRIFNISIANLGDGIYLVNNLFSPIEKYQPFSYWYKNMFRAKGHIPENKADKKGYSIIEDHEIFNNSGYKKGDIIDVIDYRYIGRRNRNRRHNNKLLTDLAIVNIETEYGPGTGTISVVQKNERSGILLNMGCEAWLMKDQLEREEISTIVKNAFTYLNSSH